MAALVAALGTAPTQRRAGARSDAGESTLSRVIRREFFARAGVPAARYGIDPDAVVAYCAVHRPASPLNASRMIVHLEDLTQAVACLAGVALAWSDLVESHESSLLRLVRERFDEQGSLVAVRRWFLTLRRNSHAASRGLTAAQPLVAARAAPADRRPSIDEYPGVRPLRHWLAERLLAELSGNGTLKSNRPLRLTGREFGVSMASLSELSGSALPDSALSGSVMSGRSPAEPSLAQEAPSRSAR